MTVSLFQSASAIQLRRVRFSTVQYHIILIPCAPIGAFLIPTLNYMKAIISSIRFKNR